MQRQETKFKATKELVQWEDKTISLVERIINAKTGKLISEKETDVVIYQKRKGLCYYVKCETIEPNNEEDVKE